MPLTLPQSATRVATRPHPTGPRGDHPMTRTVYPDGRIGWLATGRGAARAVVGDSRFHCRFGSAHALAPLPGPGPEPARSLPSGPWPPDPPRVHAVPPRVERVAIYVAECLDAMARKGSPADLVDAFARPVAALVAADPDRVPDPAALVAAADRPPGPGAADPYAAAGWSPGPADPQAAEGVSYGPGPADPDGIADLLALAAFALLREPARLPAWRADAGPGEAATAELLRYLDVIPHTLYTAAVDVIVAGRLVRAGESVTVSIQAVNRDPDLAARRPTTGPTGREPLIGPGREAAALLLRTALPSLLRRFPGLTLAVPPGEVPTRGDRTGPRRLPVSW